MYFYQTELPLKKNYFLVSFFEGGEHRIHQIIPYLGVSHMEKSILYQSFYLRESVPFCEYLLLLVFFFC